MKAFLKIILLTHLISLVTCKGQTKNTMVEKFDFEVYKKTEYGENRYLKNDGFEIIEMAFMKDKKGFQREFEPKPSFKKIYKRFYGNGNLNSKETYIGENVKIGISEYYDEDGALDKKVNEDEKFGKIKYTDCLAFLDKKGYIDLKTGKGREDKDARPLFELYFNDENGHKSWIISIIKGKPNNAIPTGPGEPLDALPLDFIMDGETGKVTEEK
ncbi:hypothetical protein BWK59_10190 [Flavobacterium davisii]|uniref:Uncharacterized protein n=1 Tax=Flavobacterium davisii TaxID=2906077 RepID=A0A246GH84_9FLAO|nr:hypothetical protein [Flavobacterium davisii]OWP83515.1 hypothetical protein BWK59_10190 [Flavobacterium davisii]